MLEPPDHFGGHRLDLRPFVNVFLVLGAQNWMQSNESQVKGNDYMDCVSVVADTASLCGWQRALVTLYSLLSTRTEGSLVLFSITLFPAPPLDVSEKS